MLSLLPAKMATPDRKKKWWGWGWDDFVVQEDDPILSALGDFFDDAPASSSMHPIPSLDKVKLRAPRFELPRSPFRVVVPTDVLHVSSVHATLDSELAPSNVETKQVDVDLRALCSTSPFDRLQHTYGRSTRDLFVAINAETDHKAPDYVAFPTTEVDIFALMHFCETHRIALVPYGGGSSVCGGVSGPEYDDSSSASHSLSSSSVSSASSYAGFISVDMRRMNQLLSVDRETRAIRVQSGACGPQLEAALKPHGFTLRHFPQSFEFSTVGGWVATRAGGHFATRYTHIDDYVQSVRVVTPRGVVQTRRLNASGAGPDPNRLFLGSEGVLGIITEVSLRVFPAVASDCRVVRAVSFPSFFDGAKAVRAVTQSGLTPSNLRLVDGMEATFMGLAQQAFTATLILAFESTPETKDTLEPAMKAALALCERHRGWWKDEKKSSSTPAPTAAAATETKKTAQTETAAELAGQDRDASAENWKHNFIRAPYLRDALVRKGFICETFETATTWDKFFTLHAALNLAVRNAAASASTASVGGDVTMIDPNKVFLTCRFTHAYADGPAPYYTLVCPGARDLAARCRQWDVMKQAICETLLRFGATASHHHAVGKDHRATYNHEVGSLFLDALAALKQRLDPRWVLNPGVLLPLHLYPPRKELEDAATPIPAVTRLPPLSSSAVPSPLLAITMNLTPSIRSRL